MQKKNTTKKKPTKEQLRKQLARDLAAILSNPELPEKILDGIRHGMNDTFNALSPDRQNAIECSEPHLQALLDQHAEAEGEEQD